MNTPVAGTRLPSFTHPFVSPSSSPQPAALPLPSVASPLTSQLQEELQLRRLLQQELEKGWMQPEAQLITPEMINHGLQISIDVAHQAAAAWQQEQANLSWQAQNPLAWAMAHAHAKEASAGPQAPRPPLAGATGTPEAHYAALMRNSGMPPLPPLPPTGSLLSEGARRPAGLGMFTPAQEMSVPSPLQTQMPDPSLQLPHHIPSSLTAQLLSGQNFRPA